MSRSLFRRNPCTESGRVRTLPKKARLQAPSLAKVKTLLKKTEIPDPKQAKVKTLLKKTK